MCYLYVQLQFYERRTQISQQFSVLTNNADKTQNASAGDWHPELMFPVCMKCATIRFHKAPSAAYASLFLDDSFNQGDKSLCTFINGWQAQRCGRWEQTQCASWAISFAPKAEHHLRITTCHTEKITLQKHFMSSTDKHKWKNST